MKSDVSVASTQTGTTDVNPSQNVQKKALDLLEVYREPQNDIYPSCDRLIEDLSDFFIVSRSSVKYRLTEVD